MKTRKVKNIKNKQPERIVRDHVAQNMNSVHRCEQHKDKKNDYTRNSKHKGQNYEC